MGISRSVGMAVSAAAVLFAAASWSSVKANTVANAQQPAGAYVLRPALTSLLPALQESSKSGGKPSKKSDIPLPDGPGKDLTQKSCSTCHGTDVFAKQRHDADKWGQILDNMTSKGMDVSDDDLTKITNYLVTYMGPSSGAPDAAQPTAPKPPDNQ